MATTTTISLHHEHSPTRHGQHQFTLPTGSVAKVAAAVLPSVVSIQFSNGTSGGSGSGVVISNDGLILTNNHVVERAAGGGALPSTSPTVRARARRSSVATQAQTSPSSESPGIDNLVPIKMGTSADLQVGQSVVAIGEPLGLTGTVTTGIVSAINRPVTAGDGGANSSVLNAIQTDAAINPGNSGGALVNLKGELVGINSAIATLGASTGGQSGSIGLGFAIPIDEAKWIADELVQNGTATHSQLGISIGDATGDTLGAKVESVENGSAADPAGLRSGDVVTSFNGESIDSADSLVAAVRAIKPGTTVKLEYVRDGSTQSTEVTLAAVSANQS